MPAILVGCGLRRAELANLPVEKIQIRQGHWVIVDLVGKGGNIRTISIPHWAKEEVGPLDDCGQDQQRTSVPCHTQEWSGLGRLHQRERRLARGESILPQHRARARSPHDLRRTCATPAAAN